jgi:Ser/Thr protein kinase RdoA (MazF antagonist)
LSVSFPIQDKSGNSIQSINASEGLRYAVLFSYAEGDKIRNLSYENCKQIGSTMANFHQVSQNLKFSNRANYSLEQFVDIPIKKVGQIITKAHQETAFMKKAKKIISDTFSKANHNELRKGVIHLDIWYDNMNITENSKITFFDFDFCGNGWLLFDIAYTSAQLFMTEPNKTNYEEKLNSFYKGYESVFKINEEEKRLVPIAGLAIWIFYSGVQAERFKDWSNLFFSENYLTHFYGMIKNWLSYHNIEV